MSRAGDMQRARSYLAVDFRATTSEDELRQFLGRSALLDYSQSHWSNRQVSIGGTGHLEGDVSTKSGGKIPLTLTFVKENGGWKIYSIQKSRAGLVAESGGQAIPSKTEAAKLAVDTTLSFAFAYIRAGCVGTGRIASGGLLPVYGIPRQLLLQIRLSVYGLEDCGYQRPRQSCSPVSGTPASVGMVPPEPLENNPLGRPTRKPDMWIWDDYTFSATSRYQSGQLAHRNFVPK